MAIRYDHIQAAQNSFMIVNGTADTIPKAAAVYTDEEIFRAYINPGFNGTIEWIEAALVTQVTGTAVANTLTGKWQIRARGESAWVDLVAIPSTALTDAQQDVEANVAYDAVAATNTAPWELRLIISTSASTTLSFVFTAASLTVRTVGESV